MQHPYKVRWAELVQEGDNRVQERQARKMAQVGKVLKRAGFVLTETDETGFLIYLRPDKPASKTRH